VTRIERTPEEAAELARLELKWRSQFGPSAKALNEELRSLTDADGVEADDLVLGRVPTAEDLAAYTTRFEHLVRPTNSPESK